jgi:hypothetical protein
MTLTPATIKRLKHFPQVPHVWEGAKVSFPSLPEEEAHGQQMVLWIDGTEGVARSLESADEGLGHEVLVRAFLRAIEYPQGPFPQVRPQKVLVADREELFYLRGILGDLDIEVSYVPELPTVKHLLDRFSSFQRQSRIKLANPYEHLLQEAAREIWQTAPWRILHDFQILQITIDRWEIKNLYACVMGIMEEEYGILLYRSQESVRQFRMAALQGNEEDDLDGLEKTFLSQDCIFCTFDVDDRQRSAGQPPHFKHVSFGSIHPLEGVRSTLDAEESLATYSALMAIKSFFTSDKKKLDPENGRLCQRQVQVTLPLADLSKAERKVTVQVSTMPEFSQELWDIGEDLDDEDDDDDGALQDDLIPLNSVLSMALTPWPLLEKLADTTKLFTVKIQKPIKEGLPTLVVQSTRADITPTIKAIEQSGGIESLLFTRVAHPITDQSLYLAIVMLGDGQFQLVGEFSTAQGLEWIQYCRKSRGRCSLMLAQGLRRNAVAIGPPKDKDILAVWELQFAQEVKEL